MSCFALSSGTRYLQEVNSVTDFSTCAANLEYYWIDTASDSAAGSFDIETAQTLIGLTLGAFALAYAFRMLRDMLLNRR